MVPTAGTERYRHCLSLSGCGIETHGMHGNHGKRNADVRDRANVSGNRAARRYERDVYDLNGRAEINARLHVAHDETDDQTRYQRTAQRVVAEHRTAQNRAWMPDMRAIRTMQPAKLELA